MIHRSATRSAGPLRVLLVDDNILAIEALERFFTDKPNVTLTAWATSAEEAITKAAEHQPSVVLLDLNIPGVDTLALIPRFHQAVPGTCVVMFSGYCRAFDIDRTLNAGASGYICKDEPTTAIVDLVVRAAEGGCILSPMAERAFVGG